MKGIGVGVRSWRFRSGSLGVGVYEWGDYKWGVRSRVNKEYRAD